MRLHVSDNYVVILRSLKYIKTKINVVPCRENFILFHSISYMLLALQGTAVYISQSKKQEGQITYHSHNNSKPVETAENCC